MAFADASGTRLAYVTETTEGTTPTSPTFTSLRYTSESLVRTKESTQSEEINQHRNVPDLTPVGRMASGNIQGELSYGTYDTLFESLLCGTWATNVLKNGVTRKSFTFEKTFEQGGTDSFIRYTGCLINTLELSVTAKEKCTLNFGIMGRGGSSGTAILSGATYSAANTNPVLNASSHVGSLSITGVSPSPRIKSLSLSISNNLREQPEVGSLDLAGVGLGQFVVTGRMEAYFESIALYDAIHDDDELAIAFTVGAASGSQYTFTLPKVKLMGGEPQAGGNNQDVMLPIDFQAIYDTGSSFNASMSITRAVS